MRPSARRPVPEAGERPPSAHTDDPRTQPVAGLRSLWVVRGDEGYGVRRAVLGMVGELRGHGVVVGFASLQPGPFVDAIRSAEYPVWTLGVARISPAVARRGLAFLGGVLHLASGSLRGCDALVRAIEVFQADWLHVRMNTLLPLAGLAARATSIPAYWHLPNTISRKLPFGIQALGTQLLCRVLRVRPLANSRHTAASLGNRFISPGILYPGVDGAWFAPDACNTSLSPESVGLHRELPLFLIAARVVPEKAQDRVIEAAIELIRAGRRFQVLILGGPVDGEYHQALVRRVAESGTHTHIQFRGPVSDPRPYFKMCDVVINSRAGAEPFGLTVVEAMLMQRPVLAYGVGGPAETVEDGRTGWLLDDASIRGYRAGLERVLADADDWAAMGSRARARALNRFTVQRTTADYLAIVGRDPGITSARATVDAAAAPTLGTAQP